MVDRVITFVAGLCIGFVCGVVALAVVAAIYGVDHSEPSDRIDRLHEAMYGRKRNDE